VKQALPDSFLGSTMVGSPTNFYANGRTTWVAHSRVIEGTRKIWSQLLMGAMQSVLSAVSRRRPFSETSHFHLRRQLLFISTLWKNCGLSPVCDPLLR
jgi:hypothetical protein